MNSYHDLLQQIQKKPGLYIGSPSISNLYMFLNGYQFARQQLNILMSAEEKEFRHFQPWLQEKFGLKTSQSWSQMLLFYSIDEREAFDRIFELFAEFLQCYHQEIADNRMTEMAVYP